MNNPEYLEKDFYAVLGVSKDASAPDIKKAYRKLAQQHHPDANKGDKASEERFKEVGRAYAVLSDPIARVAYDRRRRRGHPRMSGEFEFPAGDDGHAFDGLAGTEAEADTSTAHRSAVPVELYWDTDGDGLSDVTFTDADHDGDDRAFEPEATHDVGDVPGGAG